MQAGYPEVVSVRNHAIRLPTASGSTEGNTAVCDKRECIADPAASKTPGMHRNFTRENREPPVVVRGQSDTERREKAMSYKDRMSDSSSL